MSQPLVFSGIMPANLLPFTADLAIDEPAYRHHLRWLADTRGVTGIVANGHAAEVSSLLRDEWWRALAIAVDEVGSRCPVVAGVYTDGTGGGRASARDAKAEDAAGVAVFPPTLFMWGAQLQPDGAPSLLRDRGRRRPPDRRLRVPAGLRDRLPLRDPGPAPPRFPGSRRSRTGRTTSSPTSGTSAPCGRPGRPVAMLSSYTLSLMASFLLGADGAISGMGSVTADLQVTLSRPARRETSTEARRVNDRLDPLLRVVYAPPFVDMHNRMEGSPGPPRPAPRRPRPPAADPGRRGRARGHPGRARAGTSSRARSSLPAAPPRSTGEGRPSCRRSSAG